MMYENNTSSVVSLIDNDYIEDKYRSSTSTTTNDDDESVMILPVATKIDFNQSKLTTKNHTSKDGLCNHNVNTSTPAGLNYILTDSPLILAAAELSAPNNTKYGEAAVRRRKRSSEHLFPPNKKPGRWTKDEHEMFLLAMEQHGRNWKKVSKHIPTRSSTQIRSHAQKYFARIYSTIQFDDTYDTDTEILSSTKDNTNMNSFISTTAIDLYTNDNKSNNTASQTNTYHQFKSGTNNHNHHVHNTVKINDDDDDADDDRTLALSALLCLRRSPLNFCITNSCVKGTTKLQDDTSCYNTTTNQVPTSISLSSSSSSCRYNDTSQSVVSINGTSSNSSSTVMGNNNNFQPVNVLYKPSDTNDGTASTITTSTSCISGNKKQTKNNGTNNNNKDKVQLLSSPPVPTDSFVWIVSDPIAMTKEVNETLLRLQERYEQLQEQYNRIQVLKQEQATSNKSRQKKGRKFCIE